METWWQLRCWLCGWHDPRHFPSYEEATLATQPRHRCGAGNLIFPKQYHKPGPEEQPPIRTTEPFSSCENHKRRYSLL